MFGSVLLHDGRHEKQGTHTPIAFVTLYTCGDLLVEHTPVAGVKHAVSDRHRVESGNDRTPTHPFGVTSATGVCVPNATRDSSYSARARPISTCSTRKWLTRRQRGARRVPSRATRRRNSTPVLHPRGGCRWLARLRQVPRSQWLACPSSVVDCHARDGIRTSTGGGLRSASPPLG